MDDIEKTVLMRDGVILNIRKDNTVKRPRYYGCLKNPYIKTYYSKVLYGSRVDVVETKALRLLNKWKKEATMT